MTRILEILPLGRAYRIGSWRYTHSWKPLAFAMVLLLSLVSGLLLSEEQARAAELPHNQQQAKQFVAGGSTKIMRGTPSVQRASVRALPQVQTPLQEKSISSSFLAPGPVPQPPLSKEDQRGSWPLAPSLGPSSLRPEAYPQPTPQGEKPEASPPWISYPRLAPYPESVSQAEPSSSYYQHYYQKDHSPPTGSFYVPSGNAPSEEREGLLPWTSYPRLTHYPESVPEPELSTNYYQKERSVSARSLLAPSENAPSDVKSMQTSNPKYSYHEDHTPKTEPTPTSSRDTNWQPRSIPVMSKEAQASPSGASMATESSASWVQKQPTSRLPALPLQKSELSNLTENSFVQKETLSAIARVKALSTMPIIATSAPALLALAFPSSAKEVPLHLLVDKAAVQNRVVHSTVQPSLHTGAGYTLDLREEQRDTPSSGATEEPMTGTSHSSPSAPPVGNSSSFSLSGGGQASSGSGVSPLLLLGVLILASSILRSESKLNRIFCVFPKPSSALLDPLECPG